MKTKQFSAINSLNEVLAIALEFKTLRDRVNAFVVSYNSENFGAIWANLPTVAVNADGSLGVGDLNPVVTNPIDSTKVGVAIDRAVSDNQLLLAVNFMMDFQKFLTNQAVSQGQRNQTIDDLAS